MITEQNIRNLRLGADYLETLGEDKAFGMGSYLKIKGRNPELHKIDPVSSHDCGTVCCAVGSCAISDIPELRFKEGEEWFDYENRVFGILINEKEEWTLPFSDFISSPWDYCFSGFWTNHDNTPQGAASRMREVADYFENKLTNK